MKDIIILIILSLIVSSLQFYIQSINLSRYKSLLSISNPPLSSSSTSTKLNIFPALSTSGLTYIIVEDGDIVPLIASFRADVTPLQLVTQQVRGGGGREGKVQGDGRAFVGAKGRKDKVVDLTNNLRQIRRRGEGDGGYPRVRFLIFKVGVMLTTLFLFFTTTSLVSFTLRSTQNRMLRFTFLLQQRVSAGAPYHALVIQHVLSSLIFVPVMVGILFFLFEFFNDHVLAVAVLTIVWVCEVYTVVCMRTLETLTFFPQVFFLYFTLFHIYFLSSPQGFCHLALLTAVCFLGHAMVFFWGR